jgi:uncharacterized tellurite resistance protein B-like protein
MLDALKEFFRSALAPAAEVAPEDRERALRLAAGALLFEVVRADGKVEAAERAVMKAALQSTFDLDGAAADELVGQAEQQSREAVSLFEFTALVDRAFPPEEKKRLVELLWLVTFADGVKDPLEEHIVRQVAGLLHVAHPDFIDAKIRARDRSRG